MGENTAATGLASSFIVEPDIEHATNLPYCAILEDDSLTSQPSQTNILHPHVTQTPPFPTRAPSQSTHRTLSQLADEPSLFLSADPIGINNRQIAVSAALVKSELKRAYSRTVQGVSRISPTGRIREAYPIVGIWGIIVGIERDVCDWKWKLKDVLVGNVSAIWVTEQRLWLHGVLIGWWVGA